ncbi:hypothetical protein [Curtobacterium oceanosedimentum]|nr:hypothetical protein [Curtobacterium oceanosedimentum]
MISPLADSTTMPGHLGTGQECGVRERGALGEGVELEAVGDALSHRVAIAPLRAPDAEWVLEELRGFAKIHSHRGDPSGAREPERCSPLGLLGRGVRPDSDALERLVRAQSPPELFQVVDAHVCAGGDQAVRGDRPGSGEDRAEFFVTNEPATFRMLGDESHRFDALDVEDVGLGGGLDRQWGDHGAPWAGWAVIDEWGVPSWSTLTYRWGWEHQ